MDRKASVLTTHESELLRKCKLDRSKKVKLFAVLEKLRGTATDADDLIRKFGNKCYKHAKDPAKSYDQALTFCKTAFGDKDRLFRKGPKAAFKIVLQELASQPARASSEWEFEFGKYWIGHVLGVGGQAEVRLAKNTETEEICAVKVFQPKYAELAATEGKLLMKVRHDNIIRVFDFYEKCKWQDKLTTVMVMEFAQRGELIEYLMYTDKFEAALARWVFNSVIAAVHHCHGKGIVHRDMKPDNCLFALKGDKYVVKINDFGFSKDLEDRKTMKTMVGTPQYAAPELLQGKPYTASVDIFAMGVMIFVALSGTQPFMRADGSDFWYKKIMKGQWNKFWAAHTGHKNAAYGFPDESELTKEDKKEDEERRALRKQQLEMYRKNKHSDPTGIRDLLQGMFQPDPKYRFTLEQVANHRWMRKGLVYSDNKARSKLERRFDRMDKKNVEDHGHGAGETRAIEWTSRDVEAPCYHTNFPDPGRLWFYSEDPPKAIILRLNGIIRGEDLNGETDCIGELTDEQYARLEAEAKAKAEPEAKADASMAASIPVTAAPSSTLEPDSSTPTSTDAAAAAASSGLDGLTADAEEKGEEKTEEPATPMPVFRAMPGRIDTTGMTCEERMELGLFELNFTVRVGSEKLKQLQHGKVQVFSCPSDRRSSIVIFSSVKQSSSDPSNTHMLTKIYSVIQQKGAAKLMIDTANKRKSLNIKIKEAQPDLDFATKDLDIKEEDEAAMAVDGEREA